MRTSLRRPLAALVLGAALVSLAGCSDDGDAVDASATTAHADHAGEGASASAAACDGYAQVSGPLMTGMVDPAEAPAILAAFAAAAPTDIVEDVATVTTGMGRLLEGDEAVFGDPAFTVATEAIGSYFYDNCEVDARFEVSGVDYGYSGLPAEAPAGRVAVRFTNDSEHAEPHEMVLARAGDGVTESVAELAALPMEELMGKVEMVGVVFADAPGSSSTAFFDLEPGRYVAICNLPTAGVETDPHSAHGMVRELKVL